MLHYTLNTNHTVDQLDRKDAIGHLMAPLLDGGNLGQVVPTLAGFRVEVSREKNGAMYTVSRGNEPIVTCGLALTDEASREVWPHLEKLYLDLSDRYPQFFGPAHAPQVPATTPWLSVLIHPSIAFQPQDVVQCLGDFERCLAWAIAWDEAGRPKEQLTKLPPEIEELSLDTGLVQEGIKRPDPKIANQSNPKILSKAPGESIIEMTTPSSRRVALYITNVDASGLFTLFDTVVGGGDPLISAGPSERVASYPSHTTRADENVSGHKRPRTPNPAGYQSAALSGDGEAGGLRHDDRC